MTAEPPSAAAAAGAQPAAPGHDMVRRVVRRPALPPVVAVPIDVALGAAAVVAVPGLRVAGAVASWLRPSARAFVRAAANPPFVPPALTPAAVLGRLEQRGRDVRRAAGYDTAAAAGIAADAVVPITVDLVLDRLDLTGLVLDRVRLDQVVAGALADLDLTAIVVDQVDLGRVVGAALDELDLTELVVDRVELGLVVQRALDQVDLTEIVRNRVDLAGLADEVIDEVDLPDIIRESSTGVASDMVQGARLGAIGADEQISTIIDRMLLRRRARSTQAPSQSDEPR